MGEVGEVWVWCFIVVVMMGRCVLIRCFWWVFLRLRGCIRVRGCEKEG